MIQPDPNRDGQTVDQAGGDRADEFSAHFQSSFRVLWLIAVGIIGDSSLAEDVVQEAAIIALTKLKQFEAGSNFTAWMGQIVRNVALNRLRKERRHRAVVADSSAVEGVSSFGGRLSDTSVRAIAPGGDAEAIRLFDDRVVRALNGIGELARACLLLRTLEGLEYSEISRLLEIPEGTAMSHVHRTRRYLRDRLAGVWEEQKGGTAEGA